MKKLKRHSQGISIISREKCRKIISVVNEFYGVNCLDLSKKRVVVEPRQVAMYYCYKRTNLTSTSVALMFNKDHATVLHSINIVEGRMLYDKKFKEQRPKLEELIFRVNFKTEAEFLLFQTKEKINLLVSKMSLDQCNELIENIKN